MTQNTEQEMIAIETVDQFASILEGWLRHTHATLAHYYQMPEGNEAQLPDGTLVTLSGDALNAFKLGILFAQEQLASLPIVIENIENPNPSGDAPQTEAPVESQEQ